MAAISFRQTDTVADSGVNVGCSGATLGSISPQAREILEGGTAGTTSINMYPQNATGVVLLTFQTDTGTSFPTIWAAGDYVVRLNVSSGRPGVTWVGTYMCERTSGGTFNTVTSLTGQTTDMTTGVHSHTINRPTDYTASSGSTLYIVLVFDGLTSGSDNFGVKPDQLIDTPISAGGGASSKPYYYNQLVQGA